MPQDARLCKVRGGCAGLVASSSGPFAPLSNASWKDLRKLSGTVTVPILNFVVVYTRAKEYTCPVWVLKTGN